jgi:hypothetical protein
LTSKKRLLLLLIPSACDWTSLSPFPLNAFTSNSTL